MKRCQGFSLAEVLIASAILSFVTLGIVQAVTAGQARTLDALKRARAQALAEVLLEEVLAKPYADPEGATAFGPDAGETVRIDFDNIDDYHGYLESAGAIADHADSLYPNDYQSLERSVSVVAVTNSVADLGGDHTGLQVTVSVNEPGGRVWSVERFVPEPN
ncbi:MAG: prepilin-type N-terminal cleavage/methylation domain-containing protein [Phycisphaeraceae bacterium]|nr:prepilin-type N-terminal cleavage/methylation domain-containing protein [Phycisphaeraceae bacterium]